MKGKVVSVLTLVAVLVGSLGTIAAAPAPSVNSHDPWITVSIAPSGMAFTIETEEGAWPHDADVKFCDGTYDNFYRWPHNNPETFDTPKRIAEVEAYGHWTEAGGREVDAYAQGSCEPKVIVGNMILFINKNSANAACALMAPYGTDNISIPNQQRRCYPKTEPQWTATNVLCNAPVFEVNGKPVWACMGIAREYMPIFNLKTAPELAAVWQAMGNYPVLDALHVLHEAKYGN